MEGRGKPGYPPLSTFCGIWLLNGLPPCTVAAVDEWKVGRGIMHVMLTVLSWCCAYMLSGLWLWPFVWSSHVVRAAELAAAPAGTLELAPRAMTTEPRSTGPCGYRAFGF